MVARRLPLLLAIAAFGALIVATASASQTRSASHGSFTVEPLSSDAVGATYVGSKSVSGRIARTDQSLLRLKSSKPVNVLIKYDFDATASYAGGVHGLRATSPRVTGLKLSKNKAAVRAYNRYTARYAKAVSRAIRANVHGVLIRRSFRSAYGGVAARVPGNAIAKLLQIRGVSAVQRDAIQHPLDDNTAFIGATDVWPSLGGSTTAGKNVIVGVIDTGLWPEHPMYADNGLPPVGRSFGCQFGDGTDTSHLGPTFACNNKLIAAYAFTSTYMAVVGAGADQFCNNTTHKCSARDAEGHGTHTSTTAAGDCVASAVLYGVERGPVCGLAPGARVIMYRVCLSAGCFNSDSVSAVNQAIADGVNVINFSISGGGNPYSDSVELAFLDATNAGISVNASAGNSGPGPSTSDHGGPWVTTVAASTGPRFFTSTLHLTADGGDTFDMPGVTLTNGISTATPVVLAQSIAGEDELCQTKLPAGAAAGMIVACKRGTNARVDKGFNVFSGGAVGMILYNPIKQDVETDNHWLPAIHVDGPATALLAFINGHTGVKAAFGQGIPTATQPDIMATFSSRGPTGDWIKPDVTAPGIQVLAGMTPQPTGSVNGPPGNFYQAIAGTSMSSPHAAGVSALVKAAHPNWTPEEIKSALMTSSVQDVLKEDGTTPANPFDDGAGSIRANRAVSPTLVFNESTADFVAAGTNVLRRIDLNLASVDAPIMAGEITTKRTAINVSGVDQQLQVQTTAPGGSKIIVSRHAPGPAGAQPANTLGVGANKSLDFWVTIDGSEQAPGQYFGQITLDPVQAGATSVVIPVAWTKKQGAVTLTNTCSPTSFAASVGVAHCAATMTNFARVPANTNLDVSGSPHELEFSNPSGSATIVGHGEGVTWNGTLSAATPAQVTSITPGSDPDIGGYFDISPFGIAKLSAGDDTISNITVPAFNYGGETYTSLGVGSNGTLVIGGGSAADATPFFQSFPNPARPNNVVAPFWTDLNPGAIPGTAPGGVRAVLLSDSVAHKRWILVDWFQVPNFGGDFTHSFQVWIETNKLSNGSPTADGERISIEYLTTGPGDAGVGGAGYGAENSDGSSGKNISPAPADNSQYTVNLVPPTPGGSATVHYDASSKKPGTYKSIADMTSNVTAGITRAVQTLTVTP